jgi:hypothetical protein
MKGAAQLRVACLYLDHQQPSMEAALIYCSQTRELHISTEVVFWLPALEACHLLGRPPVPATRLPERQISRARPKSKSER